jgi:hypothetical protein
MKTKIAKNKKKSTGGGLGGKPVKPVKNAAVTLSTVFQKESTGGGLGRKRSLLETTLDSPLGHKHPTGGGLGRERSLLEAKLGSPLGHKDPTGGGLG